MKKFFKGFILFVIVIAALGFAFRDDILVFMGGFLKQDLSEAKTEAKNVKWFDDYYTIQYIIPKTIAIGEPRYYQQNYNYLILGKKKAILFDTGPSVRNIMPVVKSLTNLPIIVSQSHLHFDHVGNHGRFKRVALPDLPYLRKRIKNNQLKLNLIEYLGFIEGRKTPNIKVTDWWKPNTTIDLGDRKLKVLYVPGHTENSIALLDQKISFFLQGTLSIKDRL